ncbi:type 11 methyltransferase [Knoellia sinensis KCTC 19936]|uniref:Type 11 methyltransferase n=1 Tax=Knoellia sinensis KCTC 19936 TaxID=1385520 RepID=A0A0A0JAS0_9MICO|nr:class I SAM-dependent methyltransferase [Knoellia sinensis]KGN34243.1 type 11 methyltransferase [Knoellia sinensis KCTC 19936]
MSTEPRRWQTEADRLANASLEKGDPTGWFEQLYAAGESGAVTMAWDHSEPHSLLADWTNAGAVDGTGKRAVVVGCGLGAGAEHVAGLGFATTGFDLSPTAIRTAKSRNPESSVDFRVADLFELPDDWRRSFDLVVEIYTVQALPRDLREQTVGAVVDLVAPGGALLAIQGVRAPDDDGSGPPWPLTRDEIELFSGSGLRRVALEKLRDAQGFTDWRAEFTRG